LKYKTIGKLEFQVVNETFLDRNHGVVVIDVVYSNNNSLGNKTQTYFYRQGRRYLRLLKSSRDLPVAPKVVLARSLAPEVVQFKLRMLATVLGFKSGSSPDF
jgi:hypothetical protein